MVDRVRIRALRRAGQTLGEIAATVGVGQRSVQRILAEPSIEDPASAPTPKSRGVVRPVKTSSPEVRFEGVPGEFSQHDFGSVSVSYYSDTE